MILQNILDSVYIIPAILDHMDKPSLATSKVLAQAGVNDKDLESLRKIRHLLEYHLRTVKCDFKTNYTLLREGLSEYHNQYLFDVWWKLNIQDQRITMLDYGCGAGAYIGSFKVYNPESICIGVDKESDIPNVIVADFELWPDWHQRYDNKIDLVLLSEVLHCKPIGVQKYLVNSSWQMLKKGGRLLIIENHDPCMEYRINKIKKTTTMKLLSAHDITKLVAPLNMRAAQQVQIYNHTAYLYEKL